MLPLDSKTIAKDVQDTLNALQTKINSEALHHDKVTKAQELWKTKGNSNGKRAFEAIKDTLTEMCVADGLCNYCEQNEASDIEHIYPKSFFPAYTFDWNNYLLACKLCNSGYKLDHCFVLDSNGNVTQVARGTAPSQTEIAFINPRTENPNDFLILNLSTYKFGFVPNLTTMQYNKADKTLTILGLNERDPLIEARKTTAKYLYDRLERIVRVEEATTIAMIELALTPHDDKIDKTKPLTQLKKDLKESFKKDIQKTAHPSVWFAVKMILSKVEPRWQMLFAKLPEAIHW
jgi:uncharacterized protein (TIGR02646 family)